MSSFLIIGKISGKRKCMFKIVYEILNNHERNKGYEKWREGREEV